MTHLLDRASLVEHLWQSALEGYTVLVYGPVGIGKTAVLEAVADRARSSARPCAHARRTSALANVTMALAGAYPEVRAPGQRALRSRLRLAVERYPGLLILDHLTAAGTAMKGFLRSLRGLKLGVLIAVDVDHPRDHEHARKLGLAYRELAVPPLGARALNKILEQQLATVDLPCPLLPEDRQKLVAAADGRPGRLLKLIGRLSDPRSFFDGRLLIDSLRADLAIDLLRHYAR